MALAKNNSHIYEIRINICGEYYPEHHFLAPSARIFRKL